MRTLSTLLLLVALGFAMLSGFGSAQSLSVETFSAADDMDKAAAAAGQATGCKTEKKKLGAGEERKVPPHRQAKIEEKLLFGVFVVGTLGVASVTTYFKTRNGEQLPGYTQAAYMKNE